MPGEYRGPVAVYTGKTITIMARLVFWLFVLFLALSFFGISIRAIIESPTGQENLAYVANLAVSGWHWVILYAQYSWLKILHTI